MIRILTDSASDLTATDSARPGVYTVPLSVTFADGTGGLDGVELTADEFYAHLKVDKVPPRTSQPRTRPPHSLPDSPPFITPLSE